MGCHKAFERCSFGFNKKDSLYYSSSFGAVPNLSFFSTARTSRKQINPSYTSASHLEPIRFASSQVYVAEVTFEFLEQSQVGILKSNLAAHRVIGLQPFIWEMVGQALKKPWTVLCS